MQLTALIAIHMTAALAATAIGPVAIWARRARWQRPTLHRRIGYTWVLLMLVTAFTALFIRDFQLPNLAGFTWIHLFIPVTLGALFIAFRRLRQGNIRGHRRFMQGLYVGGCLVAGAFTLLPGRLLGNALQALWH